MIAPAGRQIPSPRVVGCWPHAYDVAERKEFDMGYTLTRSWKQHDGTGIRERLETSEGGETYAETERRARIWCAVAASKGDAVEASTVVEIQDSSGRTVACVRDSGAGAPVLSLPGGDDPATMRWLHHLRETGTLSDRVRQSRERLSGMGTADLADEVGAEILDACAARVGALVLRVDELMSRSLRASGGDAQTRLAVRRAVESTMDGADVDGFLAFTSEGRIQVPPSTLAREKVPAFVEAMLGVSAAMLRACDAIEAHALGEEPEPGLTPGR